MPEHHWLCFGRKNSSSMVCAKKPLDGRFALLWMGGLLSSGYTEDTRLPAALPGPPHPSQLPDLAVQPRRLSQSRQPAGAVGAHALLGLILKAGSLLELGPRFESHVALAWTVGSQYLVNAAAQKHGAISRVYQGKARETCFPARRETTALRSKGRQMATRPHVTLTPLASPNQHLAGVRHHTRAEDLQAHKLLQSQMHTLPHTVGRQPHPPEPESSHLNLELAFPHVIKPVRPNCYR